MKQIKKLSLKKETIASLSGNEMDRLIGGSIAIGCTTPSWGGTSNCICGGTTDCPSDAFDTYFCSAVYCPGGGGSGSGDGYC